MFDVFAKFLSSIAAFLFPLFASYKALETSDPAQLTPWLMYWVVLACGLLVESWLDWILIWVPFYGYVRLLFLLYLVLPQTQGARIIYQTHIHPYLRENEAAIDDFIASAHDRMRAAGMAYLKRAIEYLKVKVLGMPPGEPEAPAAGGYGAADGGGPPQSYTQSLLARFSLPAARWSGAGIGGSAPAGNDFYSLLAGAVSATLANVGGSGAAAGASSSSDRGVAGHARGDMSASGTLIPSSVREADKASFIATQRERLSTLLAALDREAAQLGGASSSAAAASAASADSHSRSTSYSDVSRGGAPQPPANPWEAEQRPPSGGSGLSKSRSEQDFEKIEAESGAEDVGEDGDGASVRRRGPATPGAGGGPSSWMPWGWGTSAGSDVGKSSGVEK